jgi:hypothetical protein
MNRGIKLALFVIVGLPIAIAGAALNCFMAVVALSAISSGVVRLLVMASVPENSVVIVSAILLVLLHSVVAWGLIYLYRDGSNTAPKIGRNPKGFFAYFLIAAVLTSLGVGGFVAVFSGSFGVVSWSSPGLGNNVGACAMVLLWLCLIFLGLQRVASEFFGSELEA